MVNPSGGLISKGHPLGATGLAQCAELNWQLRGMCGKRQVENCKAGLQHNLGLGGAVVMTLYTKPNFSGAPKLRNALALTPSRQESMGVDPGAAVVVPTKLQKASTAGGGGTAGGSDQVFKSLGASVTAETVSDVNATYRFDIEGGKSWVVDLKNGSGKVYEGKDSADCIIKISETDFLDLFSGKLDGNMAFMQGKLKIEGNMMLAMKLGEIVEAAKAANPKSKL